MITKQYVKSRDIYKVIFEIPPQQLPEDVKVKSLTVVGDFNDWEEKATPLKKLKSGIYKTTVEIPHKGDYQFRYLINGHIWINDWAADYYLPGDQGEDNCVFIIK